MEKTDHQAHARFRRNPSEVMRLSRMGSAHPTRLSFLRVLLRRIRDEKWQFDRPVWEVDANGVGRAVYRAITPVRTYSLVAFAHDLPPEMRTDRVVATAWDATFTLVDGDPTDGDLDRLKVNVPLQEAGRIASSELCLSRANRSVRLFQHVVEHLARGQQPDRDRVDAVGYLMRTTAVYGSGKFGAADRDQIAQRPEHATPFQAEMLTVWLIRQFTVDIVEHLARARGGNNAVPLSQDIKLSLGVGNSTGLGMAPFIVRHPKLLDHWMQAREEALARVRSQPTAHKAAISGFKSALAAATTNAQQWRSEHPLQIDKLDKLRADLLRLTNYVPSFDWQISHPWDALWHWGQDLSLEGQEALLALLLEPHGDIIDDLTEQMSADETASFRIDGSASVATTLEKLDANYRWAFETDFSSQGSIERFWYVSEEKLEPRLGERSHDEGAELEQPLGIAKLAARFRETLAGFDQSAPIAELLLAHPQHRYMARRAQIADRYPFSEIRDNLNDEAMLPIDLMRCKLAFFGASRFDPRSDKWVRISLFQDQPYPLENTAFEPV
ncbi:MAG: hypothetical protein AAF141_11260 [Pseudomonadota bacterium]